MPDIETLDLSVKSYATIKRMGINTTEELKDRIEDVLLHTQKAGEEALEKLNALSIVPSEQRKQAIELHQKILVSASLAQQNLWDMCNGLKQMSDGKLYKELGYQNFEDYCENEVGFSRMQAHKYIAIVENVNLENVNSSLQIGVSKLYLLSTISESEQQEISEKVNLEETTVKQLKAEIDKLKKDNSKLDAKLKAEAANAEEARSDLREAQKTLKTESIKTCSEKDRANKALEKLRSKEQEITRLERENEELRSRPTDVAVVDNSAENDRKLNEVIQSLERENIKRNEEMDRMYIEDRRKLEADKKREIAQIREEYEKKLAEAVKAEAPSPEPMNEDKLKFKIYLTSTFDMLNRLTDFTSQHSEPIYKEKIKQLLNGVLAKMED